MSKRQNEGKQDQVLDNLVQGENEPLSEKERQNNKKKKNNQ
ncbi:small acid-soluble spore protein O [Cytobacillus horneckiae]